MLDIEALRGLPREDVVEVMRELETALAVHRREQMGQFARAIDVPGTPRPHSQNDLRKLIDRKKRINMASRRAGDLGEAENEQPEGEDVYYQNRIEPAEHHDMIMDAIQGLIEEQPVPSRFLREYPEGTAADGVILMLPPGSAKSTYASVIAPAWVCGRYDGFDVICTSFAANLAHRFGRRVREISRSQEFQSIMGTSLKGDNQAVDNFSYMNGSTYTAVGILGGVTGKRADLVIADDLIAGREEAESEIIREKTKDAFKDDLMTRLKPGGKVVLIGTRWHEQDPIGVVLGEEWEGQSGLWLGTDKRLWFVICLPMVAERFDDPLGRPVGGILWERKPDGSGFFTERHVELARAAGERSWSSLYQQRPSPSDGNILLQSLWKCWPHGQAEPTDEQKANPKGVKEPDGDDVAQCILVYDTAIEDGEENDYTAMTAWVSFEGTTTIKDRYRGDMHKQQNLLMIGAWRAKVQSAFLADEVMQHVKFFKPDRIVIEKRASGAQLIQELRRRRPRWMQGRIVRDVVIHDWLPPFPPGASGKVPRAHVAAGIMAEGTVWYMPGRLTEMVRKECAAFPNGKYKDWVDTVTCMLIFARNINLLELPTDLLDPDEEYTMDLEEMEDRDRVERGLYGRSPVTKSQTRVGPGTPTHTRRLYGS